MNVLKIVLLALLMALVTSVTPASAAGGTGQSANSPSGLCADNSIMVQFGPGPEDAFPLEIASHGGCVSTVASRGSVVAPGNYSHAAYVSQCKLLKSELPAEFWNAPVEIVQTPDGPSNVGGFGGNIETCTGLLKGYHSGTLTHPE